jgi:hypothetical protein
MPLPQFERGETEIKGITYNQMFDLLVSRVVYYRHGKTDPEAFAQNVCCHVESLMGIYPNVKIEKRKPWPS